MIHEYQLRILPEQAASEQSLKQYIGREKVWTYVPLMPYVSWNEALMRVNVPLCQPDHSCICQRNTLWGRICTYGLSQCRGSSCSHCGGCRSWRIVCSPQAHRIRPSSYCGRTRKECTWAKRRPGPNQPGAQGRRWIKLQLWRRWSRSLLRRKALHPQQKARQRRKILNVFCQHGASPTILSDAHPHIGTDKLPRVIENMRNTILACGGEVHFQTRMETVLIEGQR